MTFDQFQAFDVVLKQRRRIWLWFVSTTEGDIIIEGSGKSRPAAQYKANRALFQLLLCSPYRTNSAKQSRWRRPLGRTVGSCQTAPAWGSAEYRQT